MSRPTGDTLELNGKIDRYFVIPTVGGLFRPGAGSGRRGVHNFLGNLTLPTIFVNDMLQGRIEPRRPDRRRAS